MCTEECLSVHSWNKQQTNSSAILIFSFGGELGGSYVGWCLFRKVKILVGLLSAIELNAPKEHGDLHTMGNGLQLDMAYNHNLGSY